LEILKLSSKEHQGTGKGHIYHTISRSDHNGRVAVSYKIVVDNTIEAINTIKCLQEVVDTIDDMAVCYKGDR